VGACTLVNEAIAVVNGALRVTFRVEIPDVPQQSLMTVVPGSIHASTMAIKVSAFLSKMGMRNVLPDSSSTTLNTHCPLTGWPYI
jgi:hypothetical protein